MSSVDHPQSAERSLIEAKGVNAYYGQSHILRNVSLHVRPNETVTLLGRNGMGKTTLLRMLMGLLRPRSGSVHLAGRDITGARPAVIARSGLAFVPEDRGVFPNLTVEENLTFAARMRASERRPWTLARVYELFPRLAERRSHWGNQLSGGEQKMLAIGRALMTNPELILLDEATEGLAPKIRDEIWRVLRLISDAGIASIVVDKNLDDLFGLAHRHLILVKGEIVFDGSTAALRADQELIHRHLGV